MHVISNTVRLATCAFLGVYVANYGFTVVLLVTILAAGFALVGLNALGERKTTTLAVFIFSAMVAIHYHWTVPANLIIHVQW